MSDDEQLHIQRLLKTLRERLKVLELQAAAQGLSTPPHITTEIDDLRQQIISLKSQLLNEVSSRPEVVVRKKPRSTNSLPEGRIQVTLTLISLIGIAITAYFGFRGNLAPLEFQATQTAITQESMLTKTTMTKPTNVKTRPTAEQFLKNYFSLLNQGHDDISQYEATWQMLSNRFMANQNKKGGFEGYVGFWKDVATPFQITTIEVSEQDDQATSFIKLTHLDYPVPDQLHEYYVEVVWNEQQFQWLLDFSCETPFEKGCPTR